MSLLLVVCTTTAFAQADDESLLEMARSEAQLMSEAFHAGEYDTYLDLIHPKIVEGMGGRQRMKEVFAGGLGPGIEFVSVNIGKAGKLISDGDTYQCALRQDQIMKMGGQNYLIKGYLIGISYDAGQSWSFISVSNNSLANLKVHFPELSDELEVSPQSPPELVKD